MARPKKTKEEILARRRIAKRKRYAALKENEELYNIEKEKEKRRYLKRKAEKKIIGIKDLTPRAQRDRRRKWRANSKKYLQKQRAEKETEHVVLGIVKSQDEPSEHGGHDPLQSGSSNYIKETNRKDENETDKIFKLRAKIRHICYQRDKDIKTLKIKLCNVKKEHKKLKRLLNKYNEVLRDPKTTTSKKEKNVQARKTGYKRAQKHFNTIKEKEVVKKIKYFYNEDENTRVVPGIKEFITRKKNRQQKRYLNDTLKNLYKKFCIENQTISVSYSFFCKLRPFWVLFPKPNRNTCECIYHCNSELLIKALNKAEIINIRTNHELLNTVCCDRYNEMCLDRKCSTCAHKVIEYLGFSNDTQIKYYEWRRISNTYEHDGKVRHNILWAKTENYAPPLDVIHKLEKVITNFLPHCATVVVQNKNLKELKNNIQINEAVIHLDFSENYGLKHHTEIQSFHFGGSRQEVSIHTVVIYMKDTETANVSNIKIFEIASANNDEKERMIPKFVPTFKGTMAVHQVIWRCGSESNRLEMRSRSCFICQENTCCRHYHLGIHDLEKALTSQTPIFEDTTLAMPVNISQPSCSYSSDIQVKPKRHPSKQRSNIYLKQEGQAKDIIIFPAVHNLSAIKKVGDWQNSTFVGCESKSYCENFEKFISTYLSGFDNEDDIDTNKENIVENENQEMGKRGNYKGKGVGKKSKNKE
ncbi:hypothetical protein ACJJTC_003630 [Scirpophaga incertulas]